MQRHSMHLNHPFLPFFALALVTFSATNSFAIPAFSRMYGTSCSTCHIDFPKLNDFGKAFKDAGFKFPKDDESILKIPPVMLGAPANAELWPKAIWPGTIPGQPPIGLRYNNYFQYTGSSRNKYNTLLPTGTPPSPYIPATDFETGFFSIFTAGNFGSDIAFWVDDDISVAGANANGGLGQAYLKFVNIGRFMKLPENALNLKVGQIELEIPFTQALSIWVSPYDIYTQANVGVVNPAFNQQFITNSYTFAGSGKGFELSGGRHTGGYNYSIAFIDQNTSGAAQDSTPSPYVPTATGGNFGGVGIASDSNFKNIYASFNYRFNLEKDKESRNSIQAAGQSGPRDHTYLNFGTYYFYGRSVQRLSGTSLVGTPVVLTAREPYYRVGGNFTFNYRTVQINGLYMYGHDYNLLPIDASGTLVPLPVADTSPVAFVHGSPSTFSGGFVDAEWLAYPWMYVMIRYDGVNSQSDYHNALVPGGFTGSPFNGAASATRNRITPAVQFLIHPNIKALAEYQFRPSQSVELGVNPITGLPMAVNSFHTNTLVLGFEFAY
jgi:hypothetical protein